MTDLDQGRLINRIRKAMEENHEHIPEQPDCGCGCWMAAECSCSESWPCPDREIMNTLIGFLELHTPHEAGLCSHCGHEAPCPTVRSIAEAEMWLRL